MTRNGARFELRWIRRISRCEGSYWQYYYKLPQPSWIIQLQYLVMNKTDSGGLRWKQLTLKMDTVGLKNNDFISLFIINVCLYIIFLITKGIANKDILCQYFYFTIPTPLCVLHFKMMSGRICIDGNKNVFALMETRTIMSPGCFRSFRPKLGNWLRLRWSIMSLTRNPQLDLKRTGMCHCSDQMLSFNTLRPRQNGRHFADDIFTCIFMNENVCTSIEISPNFVPREPIDNKSTLVQVMAWHRTGDNWVSDLV